MVHSLLRIASFLRKTLKCLVHKNGELNFRIYILRTQLQLGAEKLKFTSTDDANLPVTLQ